jgi:hypothetical protein
MFLSHFKCSSLIHPALPSKWAFPVNRFESFLFCHTALLAAQASVRHRETLSPLPRTCHFSCAESQFGVGVQGPRLSKHNIRPSSSLHICVCLNVHAQVHACVCYGHTSIIKRELSY